MGKIKALALNHCGRWHYLKNNGHRINVDKCLTCKKNLFKYKNGRLHILINQTLHVELTEITLKHSIEKNFNNINYIFLGVDDFNDNVFIAFSKSDTEVNK